MTVEIVSKTALTRARDPLVVTQLQALPVPVALVHANRLTY